VTCLVLRGLHIAHRLASSGLLLAVSFCACLPPCCAAGQSAASQKPLPRNPAAARPDVVKAARTRAFHIVPIYQWRRRELNLVPLTSSEKAEFAWDEAADRFTFIKALFAMGVSEATNTPGAWPGGWDGVGRRYGAAVAGIASNELFSTYLLPAAFRLDPRYVNTLEKPVRKQVFYAVSRVVVTRTDRGRSTFNFSQVFGNLASAALTDAYYPPRDRTLDRTLGRWGLKLAVGAGINVSRQFLRPLLVRRPPAPTAP
jgi:hypothetical protein